jgi:hypothetical protein
MPDEDKFERLLRGKGWRRAYRLAGGNAPFSHLVDSLISAAAEAMRARVICPSLLTIRDAVYDAVAIHGGRSAFGGPLQSGDGFDHLTSCLDEIEKSDLGFLGTRLAVKAAQETFVELSDRAESVTLQEVQDRLAEVYIPKLIDHECLGRVRSGIADQNGRNVEQQFTWEQELREQLKPQARKLFEKAVKSERPGTIRAPRRLVSRRSTVEAQLHKPLVPLER